MESKMPTYGSLLSNDEQQRSLSFMMNPSNNSTSNPSLENLATSTTAQGVGGSSETNSLIQNPDHTTQCNEHRHQDYKSMSFEETIHRHVTGPHIRNRTIMILALIVVGAVGITYWYTNGNDHTFWNNDTPQTWKDSDLIPYGPSEITTTSTKKNKNTKATTSSTSTRAPFSKLHPVTDLGLYDYPRPKTSIPTRVMVDGLVNQSSYPTNSWYQSLLVPIDEPTDIHRAYAIPYVVDTVGPMPGIRYHPNHIDASNFVIQLYVINEYGLSLGAAVDASSSTNHHSNNNLIPPSHQYRVTHATPLGVTLDWNYFPMYSSVTKGMPYGTMIYKSIKQIDSKNIDKWILPTIAAEVLLAANPIVDETTTIHCTSSIHSKSTPFIVQREVELFFQRSDFTWIVFVSEPVVMQCILDENGMMKLQVLDWNEDADIVRDLVIRVALSKKCTSGVNPIYCHQEKLHPTALLLGQGHYDKLLRRHANYFPGPQTTFDYEFDNATTTKMIFNWDIQNMADYAKNPVPVNDTDLSLLVFALPHHFDIIVQVPPADHDIYCVSTLIGPACLYEGGVWELIDTIPPIEFQASRPPAPWAFPSMAKSLQYDINFTLPSFYMRGAGDTYFSGKMVAKLGRILLITEEMNDICESTNTDSDRFDSYREVCQNISLPDKSHVSDALFRLRSAVEVWINGTAEIPFVYDASWGGVVSCGCDFDGEKEKCRNKFPHCTAFGDPGLNFGNAYYNDVHFHYGYFIYAAAIVAHFDPEWGRNTFENVLLLIRCIANPSEDDDAFPIWRHKDWYQGHSWASGIAMVFMNGKNQESSSEAIAAYEAIALYGTAMVKAWEGVGSRSEAQVALEVERVGQLLTATELRSARTYWHVTADSRIKIYPSEYVPRTIGILWQTMAQCQTWFGAAAYLAYGIQLLPLTPISEYRDTVPWSKETYHIFAESCGSDPECTSNGWSVIQLALLATVGHQEKSADIASALSLEVFDSAGGNGHSLSNTLWYFATRPIVEKPLTLTKAEKESSTSQHKSNTGAKVTQVTDCGKPGICTDYVLDTIAGEYTCRQRMDWLIQQMSQNERDACIQISRKENPRECGMCDPDHHMNVTTHEHSQCPHCTQDQCNNSELNRCPLYDTTFVCTAGDSVGGCASSPWQVPNTQCKECCELTNCVVPSEAEIRAKREADCPPCTVNECHESNCRKSLGVQYVCLVGPSNGGCSSLPWEINEAQCTKCCSLYPHCEKS